MFYPRNIYWHYFTFYAFYIRIHLNFKLHVKLSWSEIYGPKWASHWNRHFCAGGNCEFWGDSVWHIVDYLVNVLRCGAIRTQTNCRVVGGVIFCAGFASIILSEGHLSVGRFSLFRFSLFRSIGDKCKQIHISHQLLLSALAETRPSVSATERQRYNQM